MAIVHPGPDMLLRIAQGDAFGVGAEFVTDRPHVDRLLAFDRYVAHPRLGIPSGSYTDDTQMSVAVAEALIGGDLSREGFAESFVRCYARDPRPGYASGFQSVLDSVRSGDELLAKIRPGSDRNGAAMRSVPLGVLGDPDQVMSAAEIQARVTHDTPGGIASSQIVALASHYSMHSDGPLSGLPDWLSAMMGSPFPLWAGGPVIGPDLGLKTALAAVTLAASCPSFTDVLRTAVGWGGDTDSVAAVACGLVSPRFAPPPSWMDDGLERGGLYGRDFLLGVGHDLMSRYR